MTEDQYRTRINELETQLSELRAIVHSGLADAARERERVLAAVLAWHTRNIDAHPSLDGARDEARERGELMVRQLRAVLEKQL